MPTSPVSLFATAVALLPSLLQAQQPPASIPAFAWPESAVQAETVGGAVHAAAPGWKSTFTAGGISFTPFLGSHVPSQTARLRLAAVHCGGQPLELAAAAPDLRDRRVTYERGPVTEFFDLRENGVEHQFLLRSLPNRGTLLLDVAVDTVHAAARDGDSHVFAGAQGGIRYGAAVAIDASGRRQALATAWTGTELRITVPDGFLAAAELPLLVDPMIGGSTAVSPSTAELKGTDIAFDASLSRYYVAYERSFSATDHDVFVALFDGDMDYVTTLTIDYTSEYWSKPRIATLEAHDIACVAAETSTANTAPFGLAVRRIIGGLAPVVGSVATIGGVTSNLRDPAIGGDTDPTGPSCFLLGATNEDFVTGAAHVYLMNINPSTPSNWGYHLNTPGTNTRRVAISKTCGNRAGNSECWAVVFRAEAPGAATGVLQSLIIDRGGPWVHWHQGQYVFPLTGLSTNAGSEWAVSAPTDHALGRRFFCAERTWDLLALRGSIRAHVFDRDGTVIAGSVPMLSGSHNYLRPSADSDGVRFVFTSPRQVTATDIDVVCRTLGLVGSQLVQQDEAVVTYSLDRDADVAVCASRGQQLGRYGLSFVRQNAAGAFAVHGQRYLGIGAGGFTTRTTGCGSLGIGTFGEPVLGAAFTIQLGNSSGFPGFVVGAPVSLPVAACPGCIQGASGATLFGPNLAVTVPLDAGLVGVTLAAQGFRFVLGGAPCLGQVELSNTIDFMIR